MSDSYAPINYYSVCLVKKGPTCGAKVEYKDGIWTSFCLGEQWGKPTNDEMAAGGFIQHWRSVRKITQQEYDYLVNTYLYYKKYDPMDCRAQPHIPVNRIKMKPIGE
jgi:hypothetical protein